LDGERVSRADDNGWAAIGLKQHAAETAKLSWGIIKAGNYGTVSVPVSKRSDNIRNLTGLDCDKVDARSPEQKAHAGRSWTKKVAAFKSVNPPIADEIVFIKPTIAPESSPFGPTRHYSGVSKVTGEPCSKTSVHRGQDFATPIGTDLIAPMAGTITLADDDLYYEGGSVFLDHGYGLVSVFMHLSEVDVEVGQVVQQGERLGATGNTGRSTGPHLHWSVKWRNLLKDDRKSDFYIDPALLPGIGSVAD
jgi:murein DD-endopeptidase MepM/ murein hydrolase activator NlpD